MRRLRFTLRGNSTPNILPRDWIKEFQAQIPNSALVECYSTENHRETLKINAWTFCPVDIMDEDEATVDFPVRNGLHLKFVTMGGFSDSIKNIGIGCASGHVGKARVHILDLNNLPDDDADEL